MQTYSEYKPTQYDQPGLNAEEYQDWLVVPVGNNRDSGCLSRSNWKYAQTELKKLDSEEEDFVVLNFGHWVCGWLEVCLVRPESKAFEFAEKIESELENYPVLDENGLTDIETEEANLAWKNCYSNEERVSFIKENREEFDFHDIGDMLGCAKGNFYSGPQERMLGC